MIGSDERGLWESKSATAVRSCHLKQSHAAAVSAQMTSCAAGHLTCRTRRATTDARSSRASGQYRYRRRCFRSTRRHCYRRRRHDPWRLSRDAGTRAPRQRYRAPPPPPRSMMTRGRCYDDAGAAGRRHCDDANRAPPSSAEVVRAVPMSGG